MSKNTSQFYVYDRITGGEYLTQRVTRPGYRWAKSRSTAKVFSNVRTAQRNAAKYGGVVVPL